MWRPAVVCNLLGVPESGNLSSCERRAAPPPQGMCEMARCPERFPPPARAVPPWPIWRRLGGRWRPATTAASATWQKRDCGVAPISRDACSHSHLIAPSQSFIPSQPLLLQPLPAAPSPMSAHARRLAVLAGHFECAPQSESRSGRGSPGHSPRRRPTCHARLSPRPSQPAHPAPPCSPPRSPRRPLRRPADAAAHVRRHLRRRLVVCRAARL